MLEEGVAERIQALLRSEMPPAQFKLLGTLRMLADGQGRELLMFTDVNYKFFSFLCPIGHVQGEDRLSIPLT